MSAVHAMRIDEDALGARAAASLARIVAGGGAMVRQPRLINRAVYGIGGPVLFPPKGKTVSDVLADCRRFLAAEIERGRDGHWTADFNRHLALEQAEAALAEIVDGEGA